MAMLNNQGVWEYNGRIYENIEVEKKWIDYGLC